MTITQVQFIYTKNYPKYQEFNLLLNYGDKIRLFEINYSIGIVQPFFFERL